MHKQPLFPLMPWYSLAHACQNLWPRVHNNSVRGIEKGGLRHAQTTLISSDAMMSCPCLHGAPHGCRPAVRECGQVCKREFFSVRHPSLSWSQCTTLTLVWSHHYLSGIRIGTASDTDPSFGNPVMYPSTFCHNCDCSSSWMTVGTTSQYTLCVFRPIYPCVFLFFSFYIACWPSNFCPI